MNVRLLIDNARLLSADMDVSCGFLAVDDDRIVAVGHGPAPDDIKAVEHIDAQGATLMPGVIDEHVHMRDPGLTHKGDMDTESRAALAGGVTSLIDMPNTVPQTVTPDALQAKEERAAEACHCNYAFYLGATSDNLDFLRKADYSRVAGVKIFLGSSTGGMLLQDPLLMERMMREIPALFAVHAESEAIIRATREALLKQFGSPLPIRMHSLLRNRQACYQASVTAANAARRTGARLHLLHLSTADELNLLSPDTPNVTAETCPQYLLFDDSDYDRLGARIKCNPAIKEASDRKALLQAFVDGRILTIATDHAPHLLDEKSGDALSAVSGMPLLQFSLPGMLTLAEGEKIDFRRVSDAMSAAPARLFRIEDRGTLSGGAFADLTLLNREKHLISDADVVSRCGWTPLAGRTLNWRVKATWLNGTLAFDGRNILGSPKGRPLRFSSQK